MNIIYTLFCYVARMRTQQLVVAILMVLRCCATGESPCPVPCSNRTCTAESVLRETCPGGLVWEPCACCMECAKIENEPCGGKWGVEGQCDEENGLKCTVPSRDFLSGKNVSGICVPEVCLKNCSRKAERRACGTDGRWYRNKCALRQKNCDNDGQPKVRSASDNDICAPENVCGELNPPANGSLYQTRGIREGSITNFSCDTGFVMSGPGVLKCIRGHWNGSAPLCQGLHPCDNFRCGAGLKCVVDADNSPMCCSPQRNVCPSGGVVVCGSDGDTYRNECYMNAVACERGTRITVSRYEACNAGCDNVHCGPGSKCVINSSNISPMCQCNTVSECSGGPQFNVCGSDGTTYSSECYMNAMACLRETPLTVSHLGPCSTETPSPDDTSRSR